MMINPFRAPSLASAKPPLRPRLLLVEDDAQRIDRFRRWLASSPQGSQFVLIEATTGGQAMGVLSHGTAPIAGICLDHDLNSRPKAPSDETTSGSDVVVAICNRVRRQVPILV